MIRNPSVPFSAGALAGGAVLALACVLLAPPGGAAQSQVKGEVSRFFFGPSGADRGPDRWGAPRLEAMRGERPRRPRQRVNVGTVAGHEPVFGKPDPRKRPRRRRVRRPLRTAIPHVVQVTHVDVRTDGAAAERAPKKAVRRSDAARSRRMADAADGDAGEGPSRAAPPGETPAAGDAGDAASGAARRGAPGGDRPSLLLAPPEEAGEGGDRAGRDCALVKVRIPAGITWSHRVSLEALGVSSITGASSRLRSEIARGATLVFRSGEGEFTVPGDRVESLTVGPCR